MTEKVSAENSDHHFCIVGPRNKGNHKKLERQCRLPFQYVMFEVVLYFDPRFIIGHERTLVEEHRHNRAFSLRLNVLFNSFVFCATEVFCLQ